MRHSFLNFVTTTSLHRCLVANSIVKLGLRFVNTLVLPDPLLTQGGSVTFLACALHQLFVRSCHLAHHGLYCSHVRAYTHYSSLQHLPFQCLPSSFSVLRWKNNRMCGCLLAPLSGITLSTRVLSTSLSSTVTSWCELSVSCAGVGLHTRVTWCSVFKLCVLPTGRTQCHQSTGSDGPHPHFHK